MQSYHHRLRAKSGARSILDDVPGIGPARRRALLKHFGSLDAIKAARLDDLAATPGVNRSAAAAVYAFFHAGEATAPAVETAEQD